MQKQMLPSLAVLTNSVTGSVSFDKQPNISLQPTYTIYIVGPIYNSTNKFLAGNQLYELQCHRHGWGIPTGDDEV